MECPSLQQGPPGTGTCLQDEKALAVPRHETPSCFHCNPLRKRILSFGLWVPSFAAVPHGVVLCPLQLFRSSYTHSVGGRNSSCLTCPLVLGQDLERAGGQSCECTFLKCHIDRVRHMSLLPTCRGLLFIGSPLSRPPVELCCSFSQPLCFMWHLVGLASLAVLWELCLQGACKLDNQSKAKTNTQ